MSNGSPQVRFIIVPDLLANAPMFKRVGPNAMRGRGIGAARGRATIQRGESGRGEAACVQARPLLCARTNAKSDCVRFGLVTRVVRVVRLGVRVSAPTAEPASSSPELPLTPSQRPPRCAAQPGCASLVYVCAVLCWRRVMHLLDRAVCAPTVRARREVPNHGLEADNN